MSFLGMKPRRIPSAFDRLERLNKLVDSYCDLLLGRCTYADRPLVVESKDQWRILAVDFRNAVKKRNEARSACAAILGQRGGGNIA